MYEFPSNELGVEVGPVVQVQTQLHAGGESYVGGSTMVSSIFMPYT
jgi:hypothetical protein